MTIRSQAGVLAVLCHCLLLTSAVPAKAPLTDDHHVQFHPIAPEQYENIVRSANIPMDNGMLTAAFRQMGFMPPSMPVGTHPGMPTPSELAAQSNLGKAITESLHWILPNVGYNGGLRQGAMPLCVVQFVNLTDKKTPVRDARADGSDNIDSGTHLDSDDDDEMENSDRSDKMKGQPVVVCAVVVPEQSSSTQAPTQNYSNRRPSRRRRPSSSSHNRRKGPVRPVYNQQQSYPAFPFHQQYSRDFENDLQIPSPNVATSVSSTPAEKAKSDNDMVEDMPTSPSDAYGAYYAAYGPQPIIGFYSGGADAGPFVEAYADGNHRYSGLYNGYGPYPLAYTDQYKK